MFVHLKPRVSRKEPPSIGKLREFASKAMEENNYVNAIKYKEMLLTRLRETAGAHSKEVEISCEDLVLLCNTLAMKLLHRGDPKLSLSFLRKAESLTGVSGLVPNDTLRLRLRAVTFNNFGCYYKQLQKLHLALKYLDRALKIEATTPTCDNPAGTHLNLCAILSQLNRHRLALEHARCALDLLRFGVLAAAGRARNSNHSHSHSDANTDVGGSGGGSLSPRPPSHLSQPSPHQPQQQPQQPPLHEYYLEERDRQLLRHRAGRSGNATGGGGGGGDSEEEEDSDADSDDPEVARRRAKRREKAAEAMRATSLLAVAYFNLAVEQEHLGQGEACVRSYTRAAVVALRELGEAHPVTRGMRASLQAAVKARKTRRSRRLTPRAALPLRYSPRGGASSSARRPSKLPPLAERRARQMSWVNRHAQPFTPKRPVGGPPTGASPAGAHSPRAATAAAGSSRVKNLRESRVRPATSDGGAGAGAGSGPIPHAPLAPSPPLSGSSNQQQEQEESGEGATAKKQREREEVEAKEEAAAAAAAAPATAATAAAGAGDGAATEGSGKRAGRRASRRRSTRRPSKAAAIASGAAATSEAEAQEKRKKGKKQRRRSSVAKAAAAAAAAAEGSDGALSAIGSGDEFSGSEYSGSEYSGSEYSGSQYSGSIYSEGEEYEEEMESGASLYSGEEGSYYSGEGSVYSGEGSVYSGSGSGSEYDEQEEEEE